MNSAIYNRTSWDETSNPRESINTQEQVCRKLATENGDEVIEVYQDIGKSGSKTKGRNEFLRMKEDAKNKKFFRLYILNLSRFARDLADQETSVKELKLLGIDIFSVEEGLQSEDKTVLRQVTGVFNQEQLRVMRVHTEIEHTTRLEKQLPVSRPPLGYKTNAKTKKWDIDEKKAIKVKTIFNMKSGGEDYKTISEETKVSIPTIKNILKNKSYLGIYKYREAEFKAHEPIISEEVFNKCQM